MQGRVFVQQTYCDFKIIKPLGKGEFGNVYSCKSQPNTNDVYAIKQFMNDKTQLDSKVLIELALAQKLSSTVEPIPSIINIKHIYQPFRKQKTKPSSCENDQLITKTLKTNQLLLCMEQHDINLHQWAVDYFLKLPTSTYVAKVKSFMHQILIGVKQCHDRRIILGDIKPANIVLNKSHDKLFLIDFGFSTFHTSPFCNMTYHYRTLEYAAPELIISQLKYVKIKSNNTPFGCNDIWSVGVIYLFLLSGGIEPFRGDFEEATLHDIWTLLGFDNNEGYKHFNCSKNDIQKIFQVINKNCHVAQSISYPKVNIKDNILKYLQPNSPVLLEFDKNNSIPLLLDLLAGLLDFDTYKRFTVHEALAHPFFYQPIDIH